MQYLSLFFLIFVVCTFLVYNILPTRNRWLVLLCASLFFYLNFDVRYVFFLLFVAVSTYLSARTGRNQKKNKENMIICIIANVGVWLALKALPWAGNFLNVIGGRLFDWPELQIPKIIAPIGISYYVLLAISYLVDVHQKKIKPEKSFLKYLLYLSYFPTIVQGPISKYEELRDSLTAGKRVRYEEIRKYALLILIGLTKKMVIADRIAIFANYCFANYADLEGIVLYAGAVSYSIQLYMDFSGCVDICRGVSGIFGIDLIDNFKGPYFSKSIKEFWGKWHISFSRWLKDYIYIPLGGNRKGKIKKYRNLLITFFVSGVWHGISLNYFVWGMLQGIYQIVGECTYGIRERIKKNLRIQPHSFSDKLYSVIITFNLTTFAWIFFRSGRLLNAIEYIRRMFQSIQLWRILDGSVFINNFRFEQFVIMSLNVIIIFIIDYLKAKKDVSIELAIVKTHVILRWFIYLLLVYNIILFGVYGKGYDMSAFLYGGF